MREVLQDQMCFVNVHGLSFMYYRWLTDFYNFINKNSALKEGKKNHKVNDWMDNPMQV